MRLTIGFKITFILASLLIVTVVGVVGTSTHLFVSDNVEMIQQMNADSAAHICEQMRSVLESTSEKMRILGSLMLEEGFKAPEKRKNIEDSFNEKGALWATFLLESTPTGELSVKDKIFAKDFAKKLENSDSEVLKTVQDKGPLSIEALLKGESQVANYHFEDQVRTVLLGIPFVRDEHTNKTFLLVSVLNADRLQEIFSSSQLVTNFMVDANGKLIMHSEAGKLSEGEKISELAIVKSFLEGKLQNAQMRYTDSHETKLGAYKRVGFAGLGVVAEVPEQKAFQATRRVQYRSILFGVGVLFLAFLIGYLFSRTITNPIQRLVMASRRISEGEFKIVLPVKGQDEVAHLSGAFNEMAKGLEERDRVKATFNKFHSKEIAEKLLSGEVKLGGETKEAIVLFTDLRGFTAYSEGLPPHEVVEMLNEYMTCMVKVIRTYGGIVDKYVGDAIMALWGVPLAKEGDVQNAVQACLEMRRELSILNNLRQKRGQPPLKMGMGLNVGKVVVGNIGSEERMEYTAIGDTVNLASRIESVTKTFNVDILIAKSIVERIQDRFLIESCGKVAVKGKTEEVEVFQVHGKISSSRAA